eukprot:CAMPEP_0201547106 /NCGR_PEP_ID=MMETSP0173_2-20130828/3513_1 /ASSEMBLY_ACC=CAM_ASM_000268 /TAXON_ID=218659 /ORGANISM="Vexillifera sp., Strain DIVA3 564/2" /LENGTH=160 /DNA_ID=CAMNT_0047956023 /DNA_START=105 /DNA_END=587 /DNA_ORIENTATION=-
MKVMCAVDGSAASQKVFDTAARMIKDDGDELFIFSAPDFDPSALVINVGALHSGTFQESKAEESIHQFAIASHKRAEQVVSDYTSKAKTLGIEHVHGIVPERVGAVRSDIRKTVDKHNVDMVVLGSRGLGALKRMVLGSVSAYALTHVNASICVVKPDNK